MYLDYSIRDCLSNHTFFLTSDCRDPLSQGLQAMARCLDDLDEISSGDLRSHVRGRVPVLRFCLVSIAAGVGSLLPILDERFNIFELISDPLLRLGRFRYIKNSVP